MPAYRVLAMAAVALLSATAEAGEPRVGFAVVAAEDGRSPSWRDTAGAADSIDVLREDLATRGLVPLPPGDLREAMERPLPPDHGAAALERARQHLAGARRAYAAFQYERALEALAAIDRELVDREPSGAAVELMAERHLLGGLVHEGRRRPSEARRSFRLLHHLAPRRRALDPGKYRPQVVSLFNQAVKSTRRRAPLRVLVDPSRASVWLDGTAVGEAPLVRSAVPTGGHWVVASMPGHRSRGALVEVGPGAKEPVQVSLFLEPLTRNEEAHQLRREIAAAGSARERRASAARLARLAGADVLVLVRTAGQRGALQGAVFRAADGDLSSWLPIRSPRLRDQAAAGEQPGQVASSTPPFLTAGARRDEPAEGSPSWYGTWWGRTLIVAGGLAVGGAVVYAVSSSGGDDGGYMIDFCFAGRDCQ